MNSPQRTDGPEPITLNPREARGFYPFFHACTKKPAMAGFLVFNVHYGRLIGFVWTMTGLWDSV
jgi:hypothetical protein